MANTWQNIYGDLSSAIKDDDFLLNYLHSSEETFDAGRRIIQQNINEEQILNDFKAKIISIIKSELRYYQQIEKAYLNKVNSKLGNKDKYKNVGQLLKIFEKNYKEVLKGTEILSQIDIKKKKQELEESERKNGLKEKEGLLKHREKEAFQFLEDNIEAISLIIKDLANDYAIIFDEKVSKQSNTKDKKMQSYKKAWLPFVKKAVDFIEGDENFFDKLKKLELKNIINEKGIKEALWKSLITKSGSPYGFVFEEKFVDLTIEKQLQEFVDSQAKLSKYDTTKTVADIILMEVELEGRKIDIGASLKMRADDKVEGLYNITDLDYINNKYVKLNQKKISSISYLRRNYNFIENSNSKNFRKFEEEITLIFGITRFLNQFIEKSRESKKENPFTMFLISKDEIFSITKILRKLIKKIESTNSITGIEGFTAEAKVRWEPIDISQSTREALYKEKRSFLDKIKKLEKSFYENALNKTEIFNMIQSINNTVSRNPIEKAFYSLDLKTFK